MRPAMYWLALQPELKHSRDKFNGGGLEAFVNMYGTSLELMGSTTITDIVHTLFWHE